MNVLMGIFTRRISWPQDCLRETWQRRLFMDSLCNIEELKPIENGGTLIVETIPCEALKRERVTTIPKGSTP